MWERADAAGGLRYEKRGRVKVLVVESEEEERVEDSLSQPEIRTLRMALNVARVSLATPAIKKDRPGSPELATSCH
jgi:hypothetical protein